MLSLRFLDCGEYFWIQNILCRKDVEVFSITNKLKFLSFSLILKESGIF